jgi:hypothetical protein
MKLKQYIIFLMLIGGCKEKYVVHINTPAAGYLVVEGFINVSGSTNILLTRSSGVDTPRYIAEPGAAVDIQTENGPNYVLAEDYTGHLPYKQLKTLIQPALQIAYPDSQRKGICIGLQCG